MEITITLTVGEAGAVLTGWEWADYAEGELLRSAEAKIHAALEKLQREMAERGQRLEA